VHLFKINMVLVKIFLLFIQNTLAFCHQLMLNPYLMICACNALAVHVCSLHVYIMISMQATGCIVLALATLGKATQIEVETGSAITNGREPRSCLGRVFNSKLGCFATPGRKCKV
jgi:hypothetical protein